MSEHVELDTSGLNCPLPILKTKKALAGMTSGLDPTSKDDRDLVRTALAENPVALLVPDHRVRDGPSGAPPIVEQRLRSIESL